MNDNFMNWGFHPNRGNLNEPPHTANIIKCWYEDLEDGVQFPIYYICPFNLIQEYSKLPKYYTELYDFGGFVVGCIAMEWGWHWDDVDINPNYKFSYHKFEIMNCEPINENLFNFLNNKIQIHNIGYNVQKTISSINETMGNI